ERARKALKAYEDTEFAEAALQFRQLALDFPKSKDLAKYRFLAELSDIRESVNKPQSDAKEAKDNVGRLGQFMVDYRDDPLLEKHQAELESDFKRLAGEFEALAGQNLDRHLLEFADKLYQRAYKKVPEEVTAKLSKIRQDIAAKEKLDDLLAYLNRALK